MEENTLEDNTKGDASGAAPHDITVAQLEEALQERDQYLAGWQRAKADFVNYRKDEMRHLEDVARYGNEDLIKDLLVVIDNFDLGLRAMEKTAKDSGVDKGIYLIRTQIEDVLRKRGLAKIEIKHGDPFDPSVAEAMAEISSETPPGAVVEIAEPGYRLHDRVIRAARVIVSKGQDE